MVIRNNTMQPTYAYFKRATTQTKETYNDLLSILKKNGLNDVEAFTKWGWTIPGMYEHLIRNSVSLDISKDVLENYLQPLEFASTLGLPRAITADEVKQLRVAAMKWLSEGMNMHDTTLSDVVKELLFTKSINFDIAFRSFNKRVHEEWNRVMWASCAAREHLSNEIVLEHMTKVIETKKRYEEAGLYYEVCVHNMLKASSLTCYACPICE